MLPTFVITLREGVEATLIVGIIAAFLVQEGRGDALKGVWAGVGAAVVLCVAVAVGLEAVGRALPQRQQEGLETVIAMVAIVAVSYMIVWMRRHARGLKGALQESARGALASGSAGALVAMAFLAVLREGFETSVFLLAVFQDASDPRAAGIGAVLGLVVALVIGYALYRGGLRINLQRFFRATGVVLALVAAGLVASAVHTAHEAGWWNLLLERPLDFSAVIAPGSVRGALLTGMFGIQPQPTVGEIAGYLVFAVPALLFVLWPTGRRPARRRSAALRGPAVTAMVVVAALLVAGCGGSGGADHAAAKGRQVTVTLGDKGCAPADLKLPAGPTTFNVRGGGSGKVTEFEVFDGSRILGEVESVTPGLERSFALTLGPGDYVLSCTGGSQEPTGTLTVTGSADAATGSTAEAAAVKAYRGYLETQSRLLVRDTRTFTRAVIAGDLAAAKRAYGPARVPYERIEPVAESIGRLDPAIDARAGDVPKAKWTGFHVLEKALWADGTTQGMKPVATRLQADVEKLATLVKTVKLEPAQVANGAVALLGEVSKSKITGEEERYSHIDLVDFEANVQGSRAAYEIVAPLLRKREPELADQIQGRFAAVQKMLEPYRKGDGFVGYAALGDQDTRTLSRGIDALAEPLSQVPSRIIA